MLAAHGAVRAQVAVAMAAGDASEFGADLAVSVTGVAGPDGGAGASRSGSRTSHSRSRRASTVRRFALAGDRAATSGERGGRAGAVLG